MSKYKETKLGDLIGIKHGYAFKGKDIIDTDNGIVLVTPGNFDFGGGFKDTGKKFFKGEIPEEFILKSNDLIVTMTDLSKNADTLGYSALIPSDENIYLHNQRIGLIDIKSDLIYEDYLYWVLRTPWYQRRIANTSTGVNVKHTSPRKIYEYKFSLPDLETQEKIADILSTYDRLIENNNRRIEILEKTAEEIYKEWFIRMRFPGHENTKFIKGIPEGWEVITLGQIVTFINGYAFSSVDYLEEGQYKIITIKNVKDGNIDTLNTVFLNGFPKNMNDNIKLNIGDMLLSLTGNVGRVGLVTEENLLLNQRVAKIEPINKKYSGFIYFLFRSDNNKSKLIDISTGAAQQNLSPAKALKIKFIGNYNKIIEFSSRVEPIIKCIIKIKIQNQNLIKQRDLLLPRLMNGTIQVK